MTTLNEQITASMQSATHADVRQLNEAIRKTERMLAAMKQTRDELSRGFTPADSLDQESNIRLDLVKSGGRVKWIRISEAASRVGMSVEQIIREFIPGWQAKGQAHFAWETWWVSAPAVISITAARVSDDDGDRFDESFFGPRAA